MLDSGVKAWKPQKGKTNVIMFVGLQGSGKTTTVTKLGAYYKKKGWRPALVCCDTFRAGAYPQLAQNATRAGIHFYGSETEKDPVKLAREGLQIAKDKGNDIVIIDTSGRHKQEAALFEEMEQIVAVVKPDQIIFVMDGSIGQAAYDQALAFKEAVDIGAVILTKLDGRAKGGGSLSAVAATKSPIIFIGTGEDPIHDLQEFQANSFVSRLLGMGDVPRILDLVKEVSNPNSTKRLQEGKFSLRDMYDQFQNILKMGPLDQVIDMLPMDTGLHQLLKGSKGESGHQKIKSYMTIMDSMTDEELDIPKVLNPNRISRISRGSGRSVKEVNELLLQFKQFEKMVSTKIFKNPTGRRPGGVNQIQNMIPPNLLKQMGGPAALNNLMRQMGKDALK
jgi:signal recognition particle subunit SRP54